MLKTSDVLWENFSPTYENKEENMSMPSQTTTAPAESATCCLDSVIAKARQEKRAINIAYLTAGFPSKATFAPTVKELAKSFDAIEIGVPFSDPVADGPVAERLGLKAVQEGINLKAIFSALAGLPLSITCRLVLVGYYNNFLQHGLGQLADDCQKLGITSLLIYDLPLDEEEHIRSTCPELKLIPLLAHATPLERQQAYAKHSTPYVYFAPAIGADGAEKALELCLQASHQAQTLFSSPVGIRYDARGMKQAMAAQLPIRLYEASLLEHLEQGKQASAFNKEL